MQYNELLHHLIVVAPQVLNLIQLLMHRKLLAPHLVEIQHQSPHR